MSPTQPHQPNSETTPAPSAASWKDVYKEELESIRKRRKVAFGMPDSEDSDEPIEDLTGLALSGGGIRSALFNDGFLQALSHKGLLRYVDYISSISGGGYIAGHVNQTAMELADSLDEEGPVARGAAPRKGFHDRPEYWELGRDPVSKRIDSNRLKGVGRYLSKADRLFVRYLSGHVFTILLYLGFVGTVATIVSLIWRGFDFPRFRDAIRALGLMGGELEIAFLPFLVVLGVWISTVEVRWLASLASLPRTGLSRFKHTFHMFYSCLTWSLPITALIGAAVFMGNGYTRIHEYNDGGSSYFELNHMATWLAAGAAAVQILVFLGRDRLLKSEQGQSSSLQRLAQKVVSWGVVGLALFAMVHWMSRENISQYAGFRDSEVVRAEVRNWDALTAYLQKNIGEANDELATLRVMLEADKEIEQKTIRSVSSWKNHNASAGSIASSESEPPSIFSGHAPANGTKSFATEALPLRLLSLAGAMVTQGPLRRCNYTAPGVTLGQHEFAEQCNLRRQVCDHSGWLSLSDYLDFRDALRSSQSQVVSDLNHWLSNPCCTDELRSELLGRSDTKMRLGSAIDQAAGANRKWPAGDKAMLVRQLTLVEAPLEDDRRVILNRSLLELLYPELLRERSVVSTPIVVRHDQISRLNWLCLWSSFLVAGFAGTILINRQSPIYSFYRQMIANSFLRPWRPDQGTGARNDRELSNSDPARTGFAYPLFTGTMMRSTLENDSVVVERKPFLFSPRYAGVVGQKDELQRTDTFNIPNRAGTCLVADAVAISGSAVAPFMTDTFPLRILMDFGGFRLGQWLPRPGAGGPQKKLKGYLSILLEAAKVWWLRKPDAWNFAFVADGGFVDYLGVHELLRRRCRLIVVTDAGSNLHGHEHGPLAEMLSVCTTEMGVQFLDLDHEKPIDLGRLSRDVQQQAHQTYICMRVRYPAEGEAGPDEGLLFYAQMSITKSDPIEIRHIRNRFPDFPDEPTSNQFYTAEQVAAFRQLGYHIGSRLCAELTRWDLNDIHQAAVFDEVAAKQRYKCENTEQVQPDGASLAYRKHYGMYKSDEEPRLTTASQPLFNSIVRRLSTGYRAACYEEFTYDKDDIFAEAIWDSDEWCFAQFDAAADSIRKRPKEEKRESRRNQLCQFADEWLTTYETNADVRAAYRYAVFHDINHGLIREGRRPSAAFDLFCQFFGQQFDMISDAETLEPYLAAHLVVLAVACQQMHRGMPLAAFQIGGRRKLIDVVESIVRSSETEDAADIFLSEEWVREACVEVLEMRRCVFTSAELETAVSFMQLLHMQVSALRESEYASSPGSKAPEYDVFGFRNECVSAVENDDLRQLRALAARPYEFQESKDKQRRKRKSPREV